MLYTFDALDESTLSVIEGEYLKVVQKHDDNMNEEWWLLERLSEESSTNDDSLTTNDNKPPSLTKDRGYVPSNYIKLLNNDEIINLTVVQACSGGESTNTHDNNHAATTTVVQLATSKNSNLFEFINKPDARSNGERNFL